MHQLPGTMNDKVPRRMEGPMKSYQVDYNQLFSKLAVLKEQKETDDIMRHKLETISKNQERSKDPTHHMPNQKHSLDDPMFMEKLSALQDNDQDILDQHVSRVFSPQFSPMVPSSPGQPLPRRQLPLPPIDYSSRRKKLIFSHRLLLSYRILTSSIIWIYHYSRTIHEKLQIHAAGTENLTKKFECLWLFDW